MTGLRGRASECALLDGLLRDVLGGESRSLVLRGEPGIGKTALLRYLIASAPDLTLLRAAGTESETELAYAGLHQLCAPVLNRVEALPAPQRDALRVVFGLSAGAAPDRFLVSLAVLSLLSGAAEQRPLLCVVDDAQWLDRASALTLGFVARRLHADAVGMVFATREPGEELRALPELLVPGLSGDEARALLSSTLDERVCKRIIAETRGNPLALLELPRGLTAMQLAAGLPLLAEGALSGRIEESFVRRLQTLSGDAQRLLLVAAAEPVGDPLLLVLASERLGISVSAVEIDTDGMLSIGERVRFRHPLARSAVYRSAPATDRRAAHLALAEVTNAQVDPDRRAWHLAAAADGPDEQVARELERSASRAHARGGLTAVAAFLQRAVELTAEPGRRADRALDAAKATLRAGAFEATRALLAHVDAATLDELQRARADLLRGQLALSSGLDGDAPALLLRAAQRLEALDADLARETYLDAFGAAALAGRAGAEVRLEICRAARALPPPAGTSRPIDLLLDGIAVLVTEGREAAAPALHEVARVFADEGLPTGERLRWGWLASAPSYAIWDAAGTRSLLERQVELVREAGALEQLPIYLVALSIAAARAGDFGVAASLIAESDEVVAATGAHLQPFAALVLLALLGQEDEASTLIETTIERATDSGQGAAVTMAQFGAAVLYNGLARYEQAVAAAEQASWDPVDLYGSGWALPELVEAAARCGREDLARDALDRLARTTRLAGTDWGFGIEARSRALLREGTAAHALYREAIERLTHARMRPDLARAHLLYGEWLRRAGDRLDARGHLGTAHAMFTDLGMAAFAERTRQELEASGEKVRRQSVRPREDLTAQERQIAQLAIEGLSNPEIGARIFLSPRTVEWHLNKVFTKLGVGSRRQLAGALPRP